MKQLDNFIKKGKKYQNVKKDLDKIKTEETNYNSSFTSGSGYSSCYSLSFDKFSPVKGGSARISEEEELRDQLDLEEFREAQPMRKFRMKKLSSTPLEGIQIDR